MRKKVRDEKGRKNEGIKWQCKKYGRWKEKDNSCKKDKKKQEENMCGRKRDREKSEGR